MRSSWSAFCEEPCRLGHLSTLAPKHRSTPVLYNRSVAVRQTAAVRLGASRLAHGKPRHDARQASSWACPERGAERRVEGRKVRTPEGSAPGNSRSGQPEGQWHRKYTAEPARVAMVKRCGKSAPRPWQ